MKIFEKSVTHQVSIIKKRKTHPAMPVFAAVVLLFTYNKKAAEQKKLLRKKRCDFHSQRARSCKVTEPAAPDARNAD